MCANGARPMLRRSSSSMDGHRTIFAGASSTRASLRIAFRLVAFDLRGHGMSEAPEAREHYSEPQPWADDIAAIIDQVGLNHPGLVGWSYGGFVICDYVRACGQDDIAGINFV